MHAACVTTPERFRLATRVTRRHLTASRSLYELLAEALAQLDPRRILDIGCGEGALRAALPGHLASRVVGLDASATMLGAHPRRSSRPTPPPCRSRPVWSTPPWPSTCSTISPTR